MNIIKPEMTKEEKIASEKRKQEMRDMLAKRYTAHYLEVPKEFEKEINVVMQKSGLFEVRLNEIGVFVKRVNHAKGAQDKLEEGFENMLPRKLPLSILQYTINLFKVVNEVHGAEFQLQYYWDRENKKYIVHYPLQKTNGAHVDYIREVDLERRYLLVMDIHSHNTMGAFFSGTDDSDEKETRMFGVIGKITKDIPEMKFRVGCGGEHLSVEPWDIFDFDNISKADKKLSEAMLNGDHRPFEYSNNWNSGNGYWSGYGNAWNGRSSSVNKIEDDEWAKEFDCVSSASTEAITATTINEKMTEVEDGNALSTDVDIKDLFNKMWALDESQLYLLMREFVESGWYEPLHDIIETAHNDVWGEDGEAGTDDTFDEDQDIEIDIDESYIV